MTPEVQHYLLAGFLLLAAVFAVPLLKRILTPVKKRISDPHSSACRASSSLLPAPGGMARPRHTRGLGGANHPVER